MPYDGGAIPLGYRKFVRWERTPMIIGALTFGAFYTFALIGAGNASEPKYAIPLVGPLFGLESPPRDPIEKLVSGFGSMFLVIDAIGQGIGIGYFIVGAARSNTYLVRDDIIIAFKPQFSVGPGSINMRLHF
jgi:hypothetical protein